MKEIVIEIKNLTKDFNNFRAVDNVSLEIKRGTIFAFLGTNGAGKTTTIRMISGVLKPSSGSIKICGHSLEKEPTKVKFSIGVIPDRPYLYGKLTGREFLHFVADLYKVPKKIAAVRIKELLALYTLEKWQNELIDGYSHGMKQRLLMCSSQVHNPSVLIVDEPMVGLDPKGAKLLKETFKERTKQGLTIFMSTHSLSVAEELADELAIIDKGKIIAKGSLEDLYKKAQAGTSGLENVFLDILNEEQS